MTTIVDRPRYPRLAGELPGALPLRRPMPAKADEAGVDAGTRVRRHRNLSTNGFLGSAYCLSSFSRNSQPASQFSDKPASQFQ
jgi:hypothetical protein